MTIALATCDVLPQLFEEDRPLLGELAARGIEAEPAVWSADVDWTRFQAVLIRSCWDYHERRDAFLEWAQRLESSGIALWNPAEILRQNTEKTYLRELELRGFPVVPTVWVMTRAEISQLDAALERWPELVIKPTVSAGARGTYRVSRHQIEWGRTRLARILVKGPAMIQPFCPSILTEGELSLVYFAGKFSHAVKKLGPPGEFRIQHQYGGTAIGAVPTPEQMVVANRLLSGGAGELLYARVDLVEWLGRPALIELELTEPNLFLASAPGSAGRLADEIKRRLIK